MIGPMSAKYALIRSGSIRPDALSSGIPKQKTNAAKKAATLETNKTLSPAPAVVLTPIRPVQKHPSKKDEGDKKKKKSAKEVKREEKKRHTGKEKDEKARKKTSPTDPLIIQPQIGRAHV